MKSIRRNKALGLAIGEKSVVVAEVRSGGGKPEVARVAEFTYPEGTGLQQPAEAGKALGEFLREQGFSAKSAVIGLPAKWIVSKTKEVPAASADLINESLRLQAEGEFTQELKDLVFDYAGDVSASQAGSVLLMAVPRRYVDAASSLAGAARLEAVAVTPSAVALGTATSRNDKSPAMVLSVGPGGAEFTVQQGANPRVLRHVGSPASPGPLLVGELRRSTALMSSGNGQPRIGGKAGGTNGDSRELTVWDESALTPATLRLIGDALGVSLRTGSFETLGLATATPRTATSDAAIAATVRRGDAAAVALALIGLTDEGPPVDFLHSRLAPPKKKLIEGRTLLIAVAALVVIALGVWAYVDQQRLENELARQEKAVKDNQHDADVAKLVVDRISFAKQWHAETPRYLAYLRDLTQIVPPDGTYATNVTLKDDMKGTITGKTTSDSVVQSIVDRLRETGRFGEIKQEINAVGGRGGIGGGRGGASRGEGFSFTIHFTYFAENSEAPPAVRSAAGGRLSGGSRNARGGGGGGGGRRGRGG